MSRIVKKALGSAGVAAAVFGGVAFAGFAFASPVAASESGDRFWDNPTPGAPPYQKCWIDFDSGWEWCEPLGTGAISQVDGGEQDAPILAASSVDFANGKLTNPFAEQVSVPVTFTCEEGVSYSLSLDLRQANASGSGGRSGECTGQTQHETVIVNEDRFPYNRFELGQAQGTLTFDAGSSHEKIAKTIEVKRWDDRFTGDNGSTVTGGDSGQILPGPAGPTPPILDFT